MKRDTEIETKSDVDFSTDKKKIYPLKLMLLTLFGNHYALFSGGATSQS